MNEHPPRHTTPTQPDDQFFVDCLRYLDGEMRQDEFAIFQSKLDSCEVLQSHFVDLVLHSESIRQASQSMRSEEVLAMADLYTKTKVLRGLGDMQLVPDLSFSEACSVIKHFAMRRLRANARTIGAIAAVLLFAAALLIFFNSSTTPSPSPSASIPEPTIADEQAAVHVATLTAEHEAKWSGPGVRVHDRLNANKTLTLTQGLAQITTTRGAKVLLEAPCEIRLSANDNAMQLVSGRLYAVVPEHATGFTVQTASARIIDVGTEFGVEVAQDGTTRLQVYDGEVRASSVDANGQASDFVALYTEDAVSIRQDTGLQQVEFDPARYERDMSLAHLRPTFHPQPRRAFPASRMWWRGEMSEHLGSGREKSDALQVFVERAGVLLQQDVEIDLNAPGSRLPNDHIPGQAYFVQAGTRVDVYLLHFDPKKMGEDWDKGFFKLDFGRRILGIACRNATIAGVDRSLGLGPDRYPIVDPSLPGSRGLELEFDDVIKIIPQALSLELTSNATTYFDQILVLVESEETTQAEGTP